MAKPTQVADIDRSELDKLWQQVENYQQIKDQLGVSQQEIENTYALAYLMHQQKKFQVAADAFQTLMLMDLADWRFPYGFAACRHAQNNWTDAALFFTLAAQLHDTDPLPIYYAGDSFQKMGKLDGAKAAYQEALDRINKQKNAGQWKALQAQTALMLNRLEAPKS